MRLGKNERHALGFANRNVGWQYFNTKCRATKMAINSLHRKGLVIIAADSFMKAA